MNTDLQKRLISISDYVLEFRDYIIVRICGKEYIVFDDGDVRLKSK